MDLGYNKPFFAGEIGLTDLNNVVALYEALKNSQDIIGVMVWSLRFHSRKGGFCKLIITPSTVPIGSLNNRCFL
jgi:hypothetical protein